MAATHKPGESYGFFTDTSICIGCKACEVACKEWNQLQGNDPKFLADSYDNTGPLDAQNWRHVKFIDNVPVETADAGNGRAWLMMSDVCKHCKHASCMDVCPTGAIIRTEFDTVFIQQDVCNGCRNCVAACPYSVIAMNQSTGPAHKCTLCYDRLQGGLEPACAKACPTQSIQFGPLADLQKAADVRLAALHSQGSTQAQLYGRDDTVYGGLNAFFLLMDKPETYGLPNADNAGLPSRNDLGGYIGALVTAVLGVVAGIVASFVTLLFCPVLLTTDLGASWSKFWHMLIDVTPGEVGLSFKYWSPMSVGVWALLIFGFFAAVSALESFVLDRRDRDAIGDPGRPIGGVLGRAFNAAGAIVALFIASYTGVLLSVSNQPVWSDTWMLGGLFLASGLAGSAALIALLSAFRPAAAFSLARLHEADGYFSILELVLLVAFFITIAAAGTVSRTLPYLPLWLLALVGIGSSLVAARGHMRIRPAGGTAVIARAGADTLAVSVL